MGIFDKLLGKKDLIHAALNGDIETVEMLLTKGADVNTKNNNGDTALIHAAWGGYIEIAEMLLTKGANIDDRGNMGKTALMLAAEGGHPKTAEMLLTKGADINAKSDKGYTALIYAANKGHTETVEMLLTMGSDVNAKSNNGDTALMHAAWGGHIETVEMLLTKGADVNAKNERNWTALMSAEKKGYTEIVQLLKQVEEHERDLRKHKEEQDRYLKELIFLGDDSIELFEKMPEYLKIAEEYLNQAEIELSEGAFAPFWDAIEKTAKTLGHFDEGVRTIKNNSSNYIDLIPEYEGVPPRFPLSRKSVEKLSVSTSTAERMGEIVRTAQRNFQFATIYEQRKTNQILIVGFTNFSQALDQMTWKITKSIDDLTGSIDSTASTLNRSMSAIHSRLGDMANASIKQHSEIVNLESARMKREKRALEMEKRALEMLDNIQHHRKPLK